MKDKIYFLRFVVLAFCLVFVACSDDDDKKQGDPIFPEVQKISCAIGETVELTFNANMNWKLSSSALWCKFVVGGELMNSCSGETGEQTVAVSIGDDATALNKSYKAEISLWMGADKKVVYEITRPSTGYEVSLLDENDNPYTEDNPATIAYKSSSFYVRANFDWQLAEWPDWIDADITSGEAGEQSTNKLYVNIQTEYTKNANEGFLTFVNEAGDKVATVPVKYEGIPEDKIEFSTDDNKWNWSFTVDGQFYSNSGVSGGGNLEPMPLNISIVAKNDKYVIVFVEDDPEWGCTRVQTEYGGTTWFNVEDDKKGNIQLHVDENVGKERSGYLMAFPVLKYDMIKDAFDDNVFYLEEGTDKPYMMRSDYDDYIVMRLTQEGQKVEGGLSVSVDGTGEQLEVFSYADTGGELTEEQLIEKYGTASVYMLYLENNRSYNLIVTPGGFTGWSLEANTMLNGVETKWDGVEVTGTWVDSAAVSIYGIGENTAGEMVVTIMDGTNGNIVSVLIISRFG